MLLLISLHHWKRTICVTLWWHEQTALYPIINWSRAVAWFNIKPNNNVWKFSLAHFDTQDSGFSKDSCAKGFLTIFILLGKLDLKYFWASIKELQIAQKENISRCVGTNVVERLLEIPYFHMYTHNDLLNGIKPLFRCAHMQQRTRKVSRA